jgi:Helix-turn-helix domain
MVKQIGDIKIYSVEDLRQALGVNARTIRDWFKKRRLIGQKIGTEWHITEENLKRFLSGDRGDVAESPKRTRKLRALKSEKAKGNDGKNRRKHPGKSKQQG